MYEYVAISIHTYGVTRTLSKEPLHKDISNYCDIGLVTHPSYTPYTELVFLNEKLVREYDLEYRVYSEEDIQAFINQQIQRMKLYELKG